MASVGTWDHQITGHINRTALYPKALYAGCTVMVFWMNNVVDKV